MTEDALKHEFLRVAEAIPVPADLIPPMSRLKGAPRRRPAMWAVAACVAAAVMFTLTPAGQRAVAAVVQLVMQFKVEAVQDPLPYDGLGDVLQVRAGETKTAYQNGKPVMTGVGMTLADVQRTGFELPLPAYLTPPAHARAVQVTNFGDDGETVLSKGVMLFWSGTLPDQTSYNLEYHRYSSDHPAFQENLAKIRSGEQPGVTSYGTPGGLTVREVTVNGQPATAIQYPNANWALAWYSDTGGGVLAGTLPLKELIKVVESIPHLD